MCNCKICKNCKKSKKSLEKRWKNLMSLDEPHLALATMGISWSLFMVFRPLKPSRVKTQNAQNPSPKQPKGPKAKKVMLGTKFKRCVHYHELRATDCCFLGGFVRSNLSKPCAIPSITFLERILSGILFEMLEIVKFVAWPWWPLTKGQSLNVDNGGTGLT